MMTKKAEKKIYCLNPSVSDSSRRTEGKGQEHSSHAEWTASPHDASSAATGKVVIRFLGTRDNFGSGGRFQTCICVDTGKSRFLIDCGASSLIAMKRAGISSAAIDGVLISHLHGDHFGGIPFFILDAQLISRREAPLIIAGPPGLARRVQEAMEIFYPGSSGVERKFAVDYQELAEDETASLGELAVLPVRVIHSSGAPSYALRIEVAGKIIAYSGDAEWTDALRKVADGADIFICECYFFEKQMKNHLNYRTLMIHRAELGCKRLIITHMGEDILNRLEEIELEVAEDGMEVIL
jgi:ribonuclease BN (tRNA processing enzyme)